MELLICILIGYVIGSLSPAALISKVKNKNLREHGTGNLGATNTMLTFGKKYGVLVMIFDIAKAVVASKLVTVLFPANPLAGLVAGSGAVTGHIFPFYMKFKGGKGLASFGGMILAADPPVFLILLVLGLSLMLIVNYSYILPMSAAVLFPVLHGLRTGSLPVFLISAAVSALIFGVHISNRQKAKEGRDVKLREYLRGNSGVDRKG